MNCSALWARYLGGACRQLRSLRSLAIGYDCFALSGVGRLCSCHRYARGLKLTVGILPPLCPWVETHGWVPATATRFRCNFRVIRGLRSRLRRLFHPRLGSFRPLRGFRGLRPQLCPATAMPVGFAHNCVPPSLCPWVETHGWNPATDYEVLTLMRFCMDLSYRSRLISSMS